MKRITFLTTLTALLALWTIAVWAAVPPYINFQGILRDGSGNPVTDGNYTVTFKIYDAPAGGTLIFDVGAQMVATTNGLFSTVMTVPESNFDGATRWLSITVDPDVAELTPRTRLVSVGFSYRVGSVNGATGGTISGNVNIASDLTVSGKATIGTGHTNTGAFAFVAGESNSATAPDASVGGGIGSTATGDASTVGGGFSNDATMTYATVGGGSNNTASGTEATVSGGQSNTASGLESAVGGGKSNTANNDSSTVSGGAHNTASGNSATVGGGRANIASGTVSTVGGGDGNVANSTAATVGGGLNNRASGLRATVAGGISNLASFTEATVGGGGADTAAGDNATVPGGRGNKASGDYSFAAGRRAKAAHVGAFVWGDATDANFASTGVNQFLIRALGGVGINTNSPGTRTLDVRDTTTGGVLQTVNLERTKDPLSFNDILQIQTPSTAPADFQFIECGRGADNEFRVDGDGAVFADGAYGGPADFSEMIEVSSGASTVEPEDVMVIDPNNPRSTVKSTEARSTLVAGIYSTKPGFLGSERDWDKPVESNSLSRTDEESGSYTMEDMAKEFNEIPLAVMGIVPCKVSAENGPIRPGDLLVTSNTPGHAMKDDNPRAGIILGKALGSLASGTGVIKVLVTLQ